MESIFLHSNGESGMSGMHGAHGSHGQNGFNGSSALSLTLLLHSDMNNLLWKLQEKNQTGLSSFENMISFTLEARGGDGGNGGNGGRGCDGHNGRNGMNGEDGGDGGDGGNGGDGGHGGNGGDGGVISVCCNEQDIDLFYFITNWCCSGGSGGIGGSGGSGGLGGSGGSSGSITRTGNDGETITEYGRSGRPGKSGYHGMDGRNGINGREGQFGYSIEGIYYRERYKLSLEYVEGISPSHDLINEPGEEFQLINTTIFNSSSMRAPKNSPIVSVIESNSLEPTNVVMYTSQIQGNSGATLPTNLTFRIKPFSSTKVDCKLAYEASINFQGRVSQRIRPYYNDFNNAHLSIFIEYPIEISLVNCARTVTFDDQAPFALQIFNKSSKDIGEISSESRKCEVYILNLSNESIDNRELYFSLKDSSVPAESFRVGSFSFKENIACLGSNSSKIISGTFKFDKILPNNHIINLRVGLSLGRYESYSRLIDIQHSTFSIQQTKKFHPENDLDLLVVSNSSVPASEVEAWECLAIMIGCRIQFWNISYYNGILFSEKLFGTKSLGDIFKGKVVIFLNNQFKNNDNSVENPINLALYSDIYRAANENDIRFYITGEDAQINIFDKDLRVDSICKQTISPIFKETSNYDFEKYAEQAKDRRVNIQNMDNPTNALNVNREALKEFESCNSLNVLKAYTCCSSPSLEDMIKFVSKCNDSLERMFPQHSLDIFFNYNLEAISTSCASKQFLLGSIIIKPGLSKKDYHFIKRQKTPMQKRIDSEDVYNVFKLNLFSKKLSVLNNCILNPVIVQQAFSFTELTSLMTKAIISDLVYEQKYYGSHKGTIIKNLYKYFEKLEDWIKYCHQNVNSPAHLEVIKSVCFRFLYYHRNCLSFSQKYCFCCSDTEYITVKYSENKIIRFLQSLPEYKNQPKNFEESFNSYCAEFVKGNVKEIAEKFVFPFDCKVSSKLYMSSKTISAKEYDISQFSNLNKRVVNIESANYIFETEDQRQEAIEIFERNVKPSPSSD